MHAGSVRPEHTEEKPSLVSRLGTLATSTLQSFQPLKGFHQHLVSIHSYVGAPHRQVLAHHFCAHLGQDVRQCIIFDANRPDARIIGVEYFITPAQFDALPPEEQPFWHSHQHEVCSGLLAMPGPVPDALELAEMRKLLPTFGKTWHFWQTDRGDPLPYGPPKLMASITPSTPVNTQLADTLDREVGGPGIKDRLAQRRKKGLAMDPSALRATADTFTNYHEARIG